MSADLDIEALLLKLRELLSDILPSLRNDFLRSDPILVKFLIGKSETCRATRSFIMIIFSHISAQGYNLRKAEEMLRKTVEWRQANNIETILERPFCHKLDLCYKILLPGFDKLGQPIFLTKLGQWDMLTLLRSSTKTELTIIAAQFFEKGLDVCRTMSPNGQSTVQCFLIIDFANFDYKLLAHPKVINTGLGVLRDLCHMVSNYYPEFLYKAVVVNVSPMFHLVWSIMKSLVPRATLEKVVIYGQNAGRWKECLLEHIEPNVLPSEYGGADATVLLDCRFEPDKDFIPRAELEVLPSQDLLGCYMEPGKSFSVEMTTKPGDIIVWNFKTETQDIGFKVECDDGRVIIASCRVDAHKFLQKGRLHCPTEATYTFTWDNSYSIVSGKKLFYAVTVRKMS